MKGFCVTDSYKIKLQVSKCPLSWQLCMTVCFHVKRMCNSSAVGASTVQTVSALSIFPFYLQIRYIISFPFVTMLSFQKYQNCQHFMSGRLVFFLPLSLTENNQKKPKLWMSLWRKGSVSLKNTLHEGFKRITLQQWNPLETPPFFPVVTLSLPHLGSWNCRWRKTHYGSIVYSFLFLMGQSSYFQCNVMVLFLGFGFFFWSTCAKNNILPVSFCFYFKKRENRNPTAQALFCTQCLPLGRKQAVSKKEVSGLSSTFYKQIILCSSGSINCDLEVFPTTG